MTAAGFFVRVQGAGFYEQMFRAAIEQLPAGDGRRLLDVGSGPGLLTRLAAERGYDATGIDADPDMIAVARRIARQAGSRASFRVGSAEDPSLGARPFDVVAAASLLAVLTDRAAGIRALWRLVAPGGILLIIEATDRMTARNADRLIAAGRISGGADVLRLWAAGREGQTVDSSIVQELDGVAELATYPLVQGLAAAWVIRRADGQRMTSETISSERFSSPLDQRR